MSILFDPFHMHLLPNLLSYEKTGKGLLILSVPMISSRSSFDGRIFLFYFITAIIPLARNYEKSEKSF